MNWPRDADGDVFRRMQQDGFDFGRIHMIDFNVDLDAWPPTEQALRALRAAYSEVSLEEPELDPELGEELEGSVLVQLRGLVTYELVMRVQTELSTLMAPFGGRCESWGVLQDD